MSDELRRAYASATETPFLAVRLLQAGLTNGAIAFSALPHDVTCTLEDGAVVLFEGGGCAIEFPDTEGVQIQLENVSERAYKELRAAKLHQRNTGEKINIELRLYLPSDLSAPQTQTVSAQAEVAQIDAGRLSLRADKSRMQDAVFPFLRIDPNKYLGVKWIA